MPRIFVGVPSGITLEEPLSIPDEISPRITAGAPAGILLEVPQDSLAKPSETSRKVSPQIAAGTPPKIALVPLELPTEVRLRFLGLHFLIH